VLRRRIEHPRIRDELRGLRALGRHPLRLGVVELGPGFEEPELGQPAGELLDALDGQIDAVGRRRPRDDVVERLAVQLLRQLVLEIVEAEVRARLRIGHVDAGDAVGLRVR
jgi:hypothetical protein